MLIELEDLVFYFLLSAIDAFFKFKDLILMDLFYKGQPLLISGFLLCLDISGVTFLKLQL